MEIPLAPPPRTPGGSGLGRGPSQAPADSFDEDVLAEIERRLEREEGALPATPSDKVELDKADLPIFDTPPPRPAAPAPEVEVDLAGDLPVAAPPELEPLEGQAPPGRPKWLYLALGAGGLALAGAGVGLWLWLRAPAPAPPAAQATPQAQEAKAGEGAPEVRPELKVKLEPFLVPLLQSSQEAGLLRLGVSLELANPQLRGLLAGKTIELRDVIYRLLRDRPAEEVRSARSKNLLQAQIKTELNHLLGQDVVFQVFFFEFVITG